MRIFITGGLGFIGSNFLLNILKLEHMNILNLDLLTYASNTLTKKKLEKFNNYSFIRGNINDSEIVCGILSDLNLI